MACFYPIRLRDESIKPRVPCGQCIGCRLDRSYQWANRCMDEAQMHQNNCFLTLTLKPEVLERRKSTSLQLEDLQLFWKRLRKEAWSPVRYYACGEYGEACAKCQNPRRLCSCRIFSPGIGRPHYHAALFGIDFNDKKYIKNSNGHRLFRSDALDQLWSDEHGNLGHAWIGSLTRESAAYVARYVMKKITGSITDDHYLDKKTGELRRPEFVVMSRRPGIGKRWYQKFKADVYPHGSKLVGGRKVKPPRYYDGLFEGEDPAGFEELKQRRNHLTNWRDSTKMRLAVREEVTKCRLKNLKRSLEE